MPGEGKKKNNKLGYRFRITGYKNIYQIQEVSDTHTF